ncbi:MAG: UbiA family prenyltransferase [Myxococcales bacterium]|nr:UbiA family prenyltransferase [Myxococcales bacterium]
MAHARDLLRLARPLDWLKGFFVLMPLPFAVASGAHLDPLPFALGLLGFSLLSSAVYVFNDLRDVEFDRMHPEKRERPLAARRVAPRLAGLECALLLGLGLALVTASARLAALEIALVYLSLNALYSMGGKHVPMLDVFLLAAGFVLRVLLGCALIGASPSNWLLLCSSALALLLALAKRRADLVQGLGPGHRPSLEGYSQEFLDQAMAVMAAMAILAYALYAMDSQVLRPGREFAGVPLVTFGVLEVLRVARVEAPRGFQMSRFLRSPALGLCVVGWLLATLWSLGTL